MGLREVMLEELRDLYSAENQLVKALPKLAKAAEDDELQQVFSDKPGRNKRASRTAEAGLFASPGEANWQALQWHGRPD
jgi:ferritin-like metal-binding protein YciE